MSWPTKDPDEVLDYGMDWTERLNGDTIATSEFSIPVLNPIELAIDSDSSTSTTTTVWLMGGTDGATYEVTNTITTAGGRTMQWCERLRVRSR